jgi:hypothetical protein
MKLRLQTGLSGRRSFFGYLKTADKYMKSLIFVIFGLWSRRHIGKIATLTTNCYCNVTNRVLRVPLAGVYPSDVAGLPKAGHAATGFKLGRFVLASTCAGRRCAGKAASADGAVWQPAQFVSFSHRPDRATTLRFCQLS